MAEKPFEDLPIQRKNIAASGAARYRVYKDAQNFVEVIADTALKALEASGIKDAYKIQRDNLDAHALLNADAFAAEVAPAAVAETPTESAATAPVEEKKPE